MSRTPGYLALTRDTATPVGERVSVVAETRADGVWLHTEGDARQVTFPIPPDATGNAWTVAMFRASDDAALFWMRWWISAPGDTITVTWSRQLVSVDVHPTRQRRPVRPGDRMG